MADTPLVSVIIPVYNQEEMIGEAVESALAQTYNQIEIIVVDNGSTDRTVEVLGQYSEHFQLLREPKRGPYPARNRALLEAKGEYVAFLDADDRWLPEKIAKQVEKFEACPQVELVYTGGCILDCRDGRSQLIGEVFEKGCVPPCGNVLPALLKNNFIMNSTVMVRRTCFDVCGSFREVEMLAADYHKWLQIAMRAEVVCINEPLIEYRIHARNISANLLQNRWAVISHLNDLISRTEEPDLDGMLRKQRLVLEYELAFHYFRWGLRSIFRGLRGSMTPDTHLNLIKRVGMLLRLVLKKMRRFREIGVGGVIFFEE